jgi:hypothetical protein
MEGVVPYECPACCLKYNFGTQYSLTLAKDVNKPIK